MKRGAQVHDQALHATLANHPDRLSLVKDNVRHASPCANVAKDEKQDPEKAHA